MSLDLATLGLEFKTDGLKKGIAAMDDAKSSADKASKSVDVLEKSLDDVGKTAKSTTTAAVGTIESFDYVSKKAATAATATKVLEQEMKDVTAASRSAAAVQAQTAAGFVQTGVSAKQTAAALRGVPAQFTDIMVGLQGGQNPLTVLLQQGGQLKDMFGGIGPAARALGGYVVGLVNPFTVAAAAVAGVGVAYFQASKEQDAFVKGMALTGNRVGVTMNQINDLTAGLSGTLGTRGRGAEAANALIGAGAASGIVELTRYSETAAKAQKILGIEVEETAKEFAKLGEDPVRASERLNKSLAYLTLRQYEHIRALQEDGRFTDAARVAKDAYNKALSDATQQTENSLGSLQRATKATGEFFSWMWDRALDVGRPDTLDEKLKAVEARLAQVRLTVGVGERLQGGNEQSVLAERASLLQQEMRRIDNAAEIGRRADVSRAGIASSDFVKGVQDSAKGLSAINRELQDYRRHIDNIRAANPNSALLKPEAIKAGEAAIRKKYAATPTPGAMRASHIGEDQSDRIEDYLKSLDRQTEREERLSQVQRTRNELTRLGNANLEQAGAAINKAARIDSINTAEAQLAVDARAHAEATRYIDSLRERNLAMVDANKSARQELEEMGLTTQQLGRLREKRMDDTIAIEERRLAWERSQGEDQRELDTIQKRIDLLTEQRNIMRQTTDRAVTLEAVKANKEAADDLRNDVKTALSNAFRDSKNPARAFVEGLANVLYTRITASLGNALADVILGTGKPGGGTGALGSLIEYLGGGAGDAVFTAGGTQGLSWSYGKAGGGVAMPYSIQPVNERGPETLSMGGKDFLMMGGQSGRVIPNGAGGGNIVQHNVVHVDARADRAQVMSDVQRGMRANNAQLAFQVRRREEYAT